ncbi:peptidoglycan-binding protein [Flavobacterium humi]|uniref:CHAP domain-containing protein n=1 Tax=Flavobacterium humi TaxID=2562683 RepID=A0A4Z0L9Q0_9FLAO|nr:peptidoglycan-binding protein [Flavobacterium humi]TGD57733.1 CHAP domain-containing protein [Flavobacterium humi]
MQKTSYQKELVIKNTHEKNGANNSKKETEKIQSLLNLFSLVHPGSGTATAIDGDFGPATQKAVQNFQKAQNIPQTGIVDQNLFGIMALPIQKAFENPVQGGNLRELIVNTAKNHLQNNPFELVIRQQGNSGPWVRSYMDGKEGTDWLWCMGFVQTIIDQAASLQGKNFKTLMPLTYSCDTIGIKGIEKNLLTRYQTARNNPSLIKTGDIFLLQKSSLDWKHTGIVINVHEDTIETIEGNTNSSGSSNGNAVAGKIRNFRTSKIDFFSVGPLV